MAHSWAVRYLPRIGLALLTIVALLPSGAAAQDADSEAKLQRIQELAAARGETHIVTPLPGSRSVVIAADTSTPLFFFLERGSIRGTAIDEFYAALESGDMEAAYDGFLRNSIMTMRVTDYGWNGLGEPMVTESGSEIHDIVFRDVDGAFSRVAEFTEEDQANYQELLDAILAALEESG